MVWSTSVFSAQTWWHDVCKLLVHFHPSNSTTSWNICKGWAVKVIWCKLFSWLPNNYYSITRSPEVDPKLLTVLGENGITMAGWLQLLCAGLYLVSLQRSFGTLWNVPGGDRRCGQALGENKQLKPCCEAWHCVPSVIWHRPLLACSACSVLAVISPVMVLYGRAEGYVALFEFQRACYGTISYFMMSFYLL